MRGRPEIASSKTDEQFAPMRLEIVPAPFRGTTKKESDSDHDGAFPIKFPA